MARIVIPSLLVLLAGPVWASPGLSGGEFSALKRKMTKAAKAGQYGAAGDKVRALCKDDSKRAVDTLLSFVPKYPFSEIYEAARDGLAKMTSAEASARIVDRVNSGNANARLLLIDACGRRSDAGSGQALIEALSSKKAHVQRAVVAAIGRRRLVKGVDGLIELLIGFDQGNDKNGYTSTLIKNALHRITGQRLQAGEDYKNWWSAHKQGFKPPAAKKDAGKQDAGKKGAKKDIGKTAARPRFFGSEIVSNRVVFVIDVSGSMLMRDPAPSDPVERPVTGGGGKNAPKVSPSRVRIDRAKFQLVEVIKALPAHCKFTIVAYSGYLMRVAGQGFTFPKGVKLKKGRLPRKINNVQWLHVWKKRLAKASDGNKGKAIAFVKQLKATGSTFTLRALRIALRIPDVDTVVLLSDGAPTEIRGLKADKMLTAKEIQDEISRINRFKRVRIDTFGVGEDIFGGGFGDFMKWLAKKNGGKFVEVK